MSEPNILAKTDGNIRLIIHNCRAGNRAGQRKLYELYFSYGMSIALRYASNRPEAEEILNEGFLKVFTHLDQYDEAYDFRQWFRRILINTAIDYHRKYKKLNSSPAEQVEPDDFDQNAGWDKLLYDDLLRLIQQLPPRYRLVFNLFALEGLKHHEIAERLNISVGTSKSNYAKARALLQTFVRESGQVKMRNYGK
ncbi:MAG: sigma-70 family RNA polymerase sigma factor [Lewinella sp.]|nr:sigma-70 family RNA polymerase sigma factor [Lewinella sp.]